MPREYITKGKALVDDAALAKAESYLRGLRHEALADAVANARLALTTPPVSREEVIERCIAECEAEADACLNGEHRKFRTEAGLETADAMGYGAKNCASRLRALKTSSEAER